LKATGYSVTVCNRSALDAKVSGGEIVMALERAGVGVIPVAVIVPAATQARSRSGWEIALGVGAEVLFEVGVSGALNFIKVNPAKAVGKLWRAAPLVLGRQLQQVNAARDKVQPDPLVTFRGIYLDTAPLLVPQGCVGRVVASPCAQCPPTAGGEL
jgi:hypothetical protein